MAGIATNKYVDVSWDFKSANTKADTHCFHNYPAMMIPQIAARLIDQYGRNAKILFDPYCGTGTALVEANIKSINAIGTDLNPLARLIAETKTSRIKLQVLDLYLQEFNNFLFSLNFGVRQMSAIAPMFNNIDFWFKKTTVQKLSTIKEFIDSIEDEKIKNFFSVAFSETVREASLTKNSEFKLVRMPQASRDKFNPDVFALINAKLIRNRFGLQSYLEKTREVTATSKIHDFNSAKSIEPIKQCSVDIVLTSPPYGDSKTTVAYGQFSRLANEWLGVESANQVDNDLMGGRAKPIHKTNFDIVDETVHKVADVDAKRGRDVYSFYADYICSIANVSSVVKKNGYACYVVGNRRVKGITLPTDEITKTIFARHGFTHENTFVRNIPNKRMPSRNSPSNKIGQTETTMNNEYIVVMQKTK